MPNCAVINCRNSTAVSGRVNGDVSFHRFPSNPNIKEKWIKATGHNDWFPTKYSTICSKHFSEASFVKGKKLRLLKKTAYPTIDILKTIIDEEDTNESSVENTPKKKLLSKLHVAHDKIEKQNNENKDSKPPPPRNPSPQPRKRILEQDTYESLMENTLKKEKLLSKLHVAKEKIERRNKEIKRLREQNRRKKVKILSLMTLFSCLNRNVFSIMSRLNHLTQPTLPLKNFSPDS
ncbi:THAP domain-containing protein 1-like [Colias croceus]|uniref:THAP domain-containing protein 1-like n=1 Tax=Colias crocea TaxID=72248 RepID=UPI001E27A0FA|nr:THAP domain-containing protein 1-like [Colias croceus]